MMGDIAAAVELFPALKDKCAVRLISQLNNAKEQSRVQQEKQGFISEVVGFFTGETRRRQDYINRQLTDVVEQAVDQLAEVMEAVAFNSRTLGLVVNELKNLQNHTELIANEVIGVKGKVIELERKVDHHFAMLTGAIDEIDCRIKARQELDMVFHRWESGALNSLPISLRGYGLLEQLWWGDFGLYIAQYPGQEANKLLQYLRDRVVACFAKDLQILPKIRIPRERWLEEASSGSAIDSPAVVQGLELLSDWATEDRAPFVTLLRNPSADNQLLLAVPHLISAERFGREIIDEIFIDRDAA